MPQTMLAKHASRAMCKWAVLQGACDAEGRSDASCILDLTSEGLQIRASAATASPRQGGSIDTGQVWIGNIRLRRMRGGTADKRGGTQMLLVRTVPLWLTDVSLEDHHGESADCTLDVAPESRVHMHGTVAQLPCAIAESAMPPRTLAQSATCSAGFLNITAKRYRVWWAVAIHAAPRRDPGCVADTQDVWQTHPRRDPGCVADTSMALCAPAACMAMTLQWCLCRRHPDWLGLAGVLPGPRRLSHFFRRALFELLRGPGSHACARRCCCDV
jgi:hypothetical protein